MTLTDLSELEARSRHAKNPTFPFNYLARTKYTDKTANGLTKCIVDFLNLSGHQAERIRSEGRMIDNTRIVTDVLGHRKTIGSVKYIKASSQNGTADISATVQVFVMGRPLGIACKWEVKMRDKQSVAQAKYEQAVTTAGGKYFLVHNWQEFMEQYESVLKEWRNVNEG
jgi:hypothetical protein